MNIPSAWRRHFRVLSVSNIASLLFPLMPVARMRSRWALTFDTGFFAMQSLFTGTAVKMASLIAIVIDGYQFAHGEPGAKKSPEFSTLHPFTVLLTDASCRIEPR